MVGSRDIPELEVGERPPSTLRNIDGGAPGGPGAGGPGAPTIKAKKRRRQALNVMHFIRIIYMVLPLNVVNF
jgi:hypothetical protein